MQRIEIYDTDELGSSIDLLQVLPLLEPCRNLRWYLLDLEGSGNLTGGETFLSLERRVANSDHGVELSWSALVRLAGEVRQIINMSLAGCDPESYPPSLPLHPTPGLKLVIEAVDSTFWAVSAAESTLIEKLANAFHKTQVTTWSA